jgi:anti-sigma regulatory factor (Ser/Thr protein kinase)
MPLGLMPGMGYEVKHTTIAAGARVLFYSDGLIEAHDSAREMFGTARSARLLAGGDSAAGIIEQLLAALDALTAGVAEQEDDITLVALTRDDVAAGDDGDLGGGGARAVTGRVLADFTVLSATGNEREAIARVADALAAVGLAPARLERLKTATAEATMNAMEHGNRYDPALDVRIVVTAADREVAVRISDHCAATELATAEKPDIDAKLEGLQSPRGWGLFLIQEMVDALHHTSENGHHVVELVMLTEGAKDAASQS